jgi:hypothetical protein
MIFFVDTNFFLQCKNYDELNWEEITTDKNINIIICRPLQEEIDRLKQDGNSRRAKKARKTSSMFREMLNSPDLSIRKTKGKINFVINFSPNYKKETLCKQNKILDIERPDDEIIAYALKFMEDKALKDVYLLTHDTNPILTAKNCGLPVSMIPDSWLLPTESDNKDKKIKKLENELKILLDKIPKLNTIFYTSEGNIKGNEYAFEMKNYKPIKKEEIENIIQLIKQKYPMKTDFSEELKERKQKEDFSSKLEFLLSNLKEYIPPTEKAIKKYKNELYPNWLTNIREWIKKYQDTKNYIERYKLFSYILNNDGNVPVENLILHFKVVKGAKLAPHDCYKMLSAPLPEFPDLPKPPKGMWKDISNPLLSAINSIQRNWSDMNSKTTLKDIYMPNLKKHDRYTFYWSDKPPNEQMDEWEFRCDEFRHKLKPEEFTYYFVLPLEKNPSEIVFQVLVSGSNIIEPIKNVFKIRIKYTEINLFKRILKMIDEK